MSSTERQDRCDDRDVHWKKQPIDRQIEKVEVCRPRDPHNVTDRPTDRTDAPLWVEERMWN